MVKKSKIILVSLILLTGCGKKEENTYSSAVIETTAETSTAEQPVIIDETTEQPTEQTTEQPTGQPEKNKETETGQTTEQTTEQSETTEEIKTAEKSTEEAGTTEQQGYISDEEIIRKALVVTGEGDPGYIAASKLNDAEYHAWYEPEMVGTDIVEEGFDELNFHSGMHEWMVDSRLHAGITKVTFIERTVKYSRVAYIANFTLTDGTEKRMIIYPNDNLQWFMAEDFESLGNLSGY